jgi:hypothetical protein
VDPYYTSQNVTIFDDENEIFEHLWRNGSSCIELDHDCSSSSNFTEPPTFNFKNDTLKPETELILGAISTMFGSSLWQLIATYLSWPVSGTHSIVSGLLGFTLVAHGADGVNWSEMIKIVIGWLASPIVSAIFRGGTVR